MAEVIYLTGAPAAGKSTLTRMLKKDCADLAIFEFGERLTDYVNRTRETNIVQTELREKSSGIATPDDIRAVDEELISFVADERNKRPVIIDSHPVTKESYGYRVTAYSLRDFERLSPTQIWMLFTDPEVAVARIASNPQGRPQISVEEARMHAHIQAGVATTYGMHIGAPVYFFDGSLPPEQLATSLATRLRG